MIERSINGTGFCGRSDSLAWLEGPTTAPLIEGTILDRFARVVERSPNKAAIKTATDQLSYKQLDDLSDALAGALSELGIEKSDRVAIVYACLKVGAILVPLNPAHKPAQVIASLNHIAASCYILSSEITLPFRPPRPTRQDLEEICSTDIPSLRHILLICNSSERQTIDTTRFLKPTAHEYAHLVATSSIRRKRFIPTQPAHAKDLVNIQFTSGTTSSPKAACLTHRNVLNNGFFAGQGMDLTDKDIICCPPPMYHCFGQVLGLMTAMTHGITLLLPAESFDPRAAMRSVVENKATVLYGVPTMFLAYMDIVSEEKIPPSELASLRTGVVGGSPVPPTMRKQLHTKMNLSGLTSVYGMTEASPLVSQTREEDPLDKKLHTVGRAMPHTSIRIAARDDPHRVLRRGEKGEVQMSGYSIMAGYWKAEEENSKALLIEQEEDEDEEQSESDRYAMLGGLLPRQTTKGRVWLRSGDEGLIDDDGYLQITGRIKDIIIRGGENIHPAVIENCLAGHDSVFDVSVVGLLDPRYGEVIASFIIPKPGVSVREEPENVSTSSIDLRHEKSEAANGFSGSVSSSDIRTWVLGQLGKMFVPKYIFWISSMPLTASGKIMKFRLREIGNEWLESR